MEALDRQGVKEGRHTLDYMPTNTNAHNGPSVTLLGQNVNSYRDTSSLAMAMTSNAGSDLSNDGFRTIYRRKEGGLRFTELLDRVSRVYPNVIASRQSDMQCIYLMAMTCVDALSVYFTSSKGLSYGLATIDRRASEYLLGKYGCTVD